MKKTVSVLVCLIMLLSCALGESADYSRQFAGNLRAFFDRASRADFEGFSLTMQPTGENPAEILLQGEDGLSSLRAEIPGLGTAELQTNGSTVYVSAAGKTFSLDLSSVPEIIAGLGFTPLSAESFSSLAGLAGQFVTEFVLPRVKIEYPESGGMTLRAELQVQELTAALAYYGDRFVNDPECTAPVLTILNAAGLLRGFSMDGNGLKEAWASIRSNLTSVQTDAALSAAVTVSGTDGQPGSGRQITADVRYTMNGVTAALTSAVTDSRLKTNVEMSLFREYSGERTDLASVSAEYMKREQTLTGRISLPAAGAELRLTAVSQRRSGFYANLDYLATYGYGWTLNVTGTEDSEGFVFSADLASHSAYGSSWSLLANWGEYRKSLSIHAAGTALEAEFVHDDDGGFTGFLLLPNGIKCELRGSRSDYGFHAAADVYGYGRALYGYGTSRIGGLEINVRNSYRCTAADLIVDTGRETSSLQFYWSPLVKNASVSFGGNHIKFEMMQSATGLPVRAGLSARGSYFGDGEILYENGQVILTDGYSTYTVSHAYESAEAFAVYLTRETRYSSAKQHVVIRLSIAENEDGRYLNLDLINEEQGPLLNGTLKYVQDAEIQPLSEGETIPVGADLIRQLIGR